MAAGISPTFYNANENINNANIIAKAIYSDGSVKQISDYTIGETPYSSNGIYDIPITYNGVTGYLRVYKTGSLGSFTGGAAYTPGTNTDILRLPQLYQGINTGINTVTTPVYSTYVGIAPELFGIPNAPSTETGGQVEPPTSPPTVAPTEPTTEAPTTEAVTDAPTTEGDTTTIPSTEELTTEEEENTTTNNSTDETTTEEELESTTEGTTESNDDNEELANKYKKLIFIILGVVVVIAGGAVVVVVVAMRKK